MAKATSVRLHTGSVFTLCVLFVYLLAANLIPHSSCLISGGQIGCEPSNVDLDLGLLPVLLLLWLLCGSCFRSHNDT